MAQRSSPLRVFKLKHPTLGDALRSQGARKQLKKLTRSMKWSPCHGYDSREPLLRKARFSQKASWKIGRELTGCSFQEPCPVGVLSGGACLLVPSCGVTHSLLHHTSLAWFCSLANFCCLIWNEGLFALMPLGKVIQLTTKFEVKIILLTWGAVERSVFSKMWKVNPRLIISHLVCSTWPHGSGKWANHHLVPPTSSARRSHSLFSQLSTVRHSV